MKRIFLILLSIFLIANLNSCVGISYYFQPDIDSNVKWSTKDGLIWFIHDSRNLANIYGKSAQAFFNYADTLAFHDIERDRIIAFYCKFKRNKIVATVKYDRDDMLGVGTVVTFYKYDISEET